MGNPKWVDGVFGKGLRFDAVMDMIPVGQNKVFARGGWNHDELDEHGNH